MAYTNALVPKVSSKQIGTAAAALTTASVLAAQLTLEAASTNTGIIYIGDSNVDSTASLHLSAGDSYTLTATDTPHGFLSLDLNGFYAAASAASQTLSIFRITRNG